MKKSIKDIQMKKNLGKILLLFFTLFTYLNAKDLASYKLTADKTTVYEKEAFTITFEAYQKDHTDNMMFLLKPKKSDEYKIILLNKKIDDKKYHSSHTSFTYLLFALKANTISVDFDFTIQTASDKAIANSYVDDHDDSIAIQTYNTNMKIKPLEIKVKKLQKDVDLVGDFHLSENIQTTKINQYESLNIIYTLEGKGYEDKNFKLINNIQNVTIFSERNDLSSKLTKDGEKIKREYIYALSAKEDFTIPKLGIEAYSPKTGKYYRLTTPKHHIQVTKVDISKLVDNEEYPQTKELINIDKLKQFFIYIIIFISGYLSAKFQSINLKKKTISKEFIAVKNTKTPKELLFILVNFHQEHKFSKEFKILEDIVYNDAVDNFKKIKHKILKGLQ